MRVTLGRAIWSGLFLPIFNSCFPPGLFIGMCRKYKKGCPAWAQKKCITQPNCRINQAKQWLLPAQELKESVCPWLKLDWERWHLWPWAQETREEKNQSGEFKVASLCCQTSQIQLLFIYLNFRKILNSQDLTFIARAMRAPSVGCPITLFFLIMALLTTQPA